MGDNSEYRYRNMAGNGPPNFGFPPGYIPGQPFMMPPNTQGMHVSILSPHRQLTNLRSSAPPPYFPGGAIPPQMPFMGYQPYMMAPPPPPPQVRPNVPPPSVPSAASEANFSLPGGVGLIVPKELVTIHVISANIQPWNNPGGTFEFKAYKVPAHLSVKELIDHVCPSKGPQNQQVVSRGIVEIHEHGNGRWLKGQEFWLANKGAHGDNDGMKKKIGKPISEYGWHAKRGSIGLPIWISCLQHYG